MFFSRLFECFSQAIRREKKTKNFEQSEKYCLILAQWTYIQHNAVFSLLLIFSPPNSIHSVYVNMFACAIALQLEYLNERLLNFKHWFYFACLFLYERLFSLSFSIISIGLPNLKRREKERKKYGMKAGGWCLFWLTTYQCECSTFWLNKIIAVSIIIQTPK